MADPVSQFATRIAYGARQLPRVAWYIGHGMVMRRLSQAARERAGASTRPRAHTRASVPDRRRLYADMAVLFRQDLANVEAGIYPLPADHDGTLPVVLGRSRLFFADLPDVHRRRENAEYRQVLTDDTRGRRPDYYLRNFHFQSGGWLTQDSARRYDTQVEVLFNGSANATRWPRLPALGVDLSEPYVAEARRHLQRWCWLNLMVANGEALPVKDESQDAVTSIFMFHELPPKVRRIVLREFARVLKPGGRLVVVDSLQIGDEPDYDGMLELFPQSYHEPYYSSYLREDFGSIAGDCGLTRIRDVNAFVSKVMVFDKR